MTDDHLCRRGPACAAALVTLVDGRRLRVAATADTPGGLCHNDERAVLAAISQLPRDYIELSQHLAKTGSALEAHVGGTRELPVPIRLGIEELQAGIVAETTGWAALADLDVCDGRPGARLDSAVRAIVTTWPRLLDLDLVSVRRHGPAGEQWSDEDGVDAALALLALHERVAAVTGRTRLLHRLSAPCPECHGTSLQREDGADVVTCWRCAARMSVEEYELIAGALLADITRSAA